MANERDNFSKTTIRILQERVAHRCSNPECRAPTSGPNSIDTKATRVGKAAHITAASEGGPRYGHNLNPEERKSINNAIWLCSNCHEKIDKDKLYYTADLLREWKKKAEEIAREELGRPIRELADQKINEEIEKKFASLEETLRNLKAGDKKTMDEALKAFREGNYSKTKELFLDIKKKENKESALTSYNLGVIAFLELDFKGALAHFLEAESLDPDNTLYINEAGNVYHSLGQYKRAIEYHEKALSSDLKTYGPEHPSVARDCNNLGLSLQAIGQHENAIEYLDKALTIFTKITGKNDAAVATLFNNLGLASYELGQYEKAKEHFEKANAINIIHLGEEHPLVASTWNNLGGAFYELGEYEKAIEHFEKANTINIVKLGEEHPLVASTWNNIGLAWLSLRQYEKAIDYFENALESNLKNYGSDHPVVATNWNNLGSAYSDLGEYEKAIKFYDKSLASDINTYGPGHPSVARDWNNLGGALLSLGNYNKAIDCGEKALELFETFLGKDHPNTKRIMGNLEYARKKIN
ncbi:MAG: tetratricopeptide repeat protein [Candidatus Aminicenantes bacterium]|nr:tetratricopeptide repeat protein [Candidatus Aminicenantes bacterium]